VPPNQNPEQVARDRIDQMLGDAGWSVQDKKAINFNASQGIAIETEVTAQGTRLAA
jgi:type I restriction enzyme R subunit